MNYIELLISSIIEFINRFFDIVFNITLFIC